MNNKALSAVRQYNMLSQGDVVIAAVSGGADSMALLCFLIEIRQLFSLDIHVCHVNHMLRGDEAMRDEEFVKDFCNSRSLPFHLCRRDVRLLSRQSGRGLEECGRDVRYSFFEETAKNLVGNIKIATAHSLSDSAETLIFRLARGTSPAGMCGISPVRENIIRPLIFCTRAEIEKYLAGIGQSYVTDSTNFDTDYSRNLIRHEIIPRLEKINPSFLSAVQSYCELQSEQSAYLNGMEKSAAALCARDGVIDSVTLLSQNIALRRGIIASFLRENKVEVSKKRCDLILSAAQGGSFKISVCKDIYAVCGDDGIIRIKRTIQNKNKDFCFSADAAFFTLPDGATVKFHEIGVDQYLNIKKNFPSMLNNCLDYDIIGNTCCLRTRREGDVITPFPRNVTKTLKKFLNESKIAVEKRDIMPLLADKNRVLWAGGLAVDKSAAVSGTTKRILFIEAFLNTAKGNGDILK